MEEVEVLDIFCDVPVPHSLKRRSLFDLERFCKREDCEDTVRGCLAGEYVARETTTCVPVHDYLPCG